LFQSCLNAEGQHYPVPEKRLGSILNTKTGFYEGKREKKKKRKKTKKKKEMRSESEKHVILINT